MNSYFIQSHGNEFLDLTLENAQSSVSGQPASHPSSLAKPLSTSLAGLTLAACGGGGSNEPIATPKPTEKEAARFLMQASFGGTYAQVQEVQNKGYAQWIDEQMDRPWRSEESHYQWLYDKG